MCVIWENKVFSCLLVTLPFSPACVSYLHSWSSLWVNPVSCCGQDLRQSSTEPCRVWQACRVCSLLWKQCLHWAAVCWLQPFCLAQAAVHWAEVMGGCWGCGSSWATPPPPPLAPACCPWAPLVPPPPVHTGCSQVARSPLPQAHAGRSGAVLRNKFNRGQFLTRKIEKVLKESKDDLSKWNNIPLSWIGRLNIIKMTMAILPKLIYSCNMIPIKIIAGFFAEINVFVLNVRWKFKGQKISKSVLKDRSTLGGITVPNFEIFLLRYRNQNNILWK